MHRLSPGPSVNEKAKANGAHGLAGGPAAGACDAGDTNTHLGACGLCDACGHLLGHRLADHTIGSNILGVYFHITHLCLVGVGHDAQVQHSGGTGHIHDPRRSQTAGAGLSKADAPALFQKPRHQLRRHIFFHSDHLRFFYCSTLICPLQFPKNML